MGGKAIRHVTGIKKHDILSTFYIKKFTKLFKFYLSVITSINATILN